MPTILFHVLLSLSLLFGVSNATSDDDVRLVLTGLDPILLISGQQESGKSDIVFDFEGFRYRFANQANRELFERNPTKYAVQLEGACPVRPDLSGKPDIFLVHEGKIYLFFTEHCRRTFEEEPSNYVRSDGS